MERFPFEQETTEWAVVAWVCRHWRAIALNDPSLWTIIPHKFSKWTPEILKRSRKACIKVNLEGSGKSSENTVLLLNYTRRMAELRLNEDTLFHVLDRFAFGSAAKLERLTVTRSTLHNWRGHKLRNSSMPDCMLPGCSNLHYLALSGMHIAQKSGSRLSLCILRTSVRHLRLSHCTFSAMAEFKPSVESMTSLYFLLLHHTLSGRQLPSTNSSITLTSLKGLDLDEDPAGLIWFFDNFALTEQQKYARIVTRLSGKSGHEHLGLLAALRRPQAVGRFSQAAESLSIEVDHSSIRTSYLVFKAYNSLRNNQQQSSPNEPPDLEIQLAPNLPSSVFREVKQETTAQAILADIFEHFEWPNLRDLNLVQLDHTPLSTALADTLAVTYGTLSNLRMISIGKTH